MSLADAGVLTPPRAHAAPTTYRGSYLRQARSELRLVFGRRRNLIMLAALGAIPLLIGIALKVNPPHVGDSNGPQFINRITGNGLFLVLTALTLTLALFLPIVVGIVAGDAIAGEAQAGTLRYLLTVPVRRGRLLLVKAAGIATYAAAAVLSISVVAAIAGAALFGTGSFTLLGGQTVSLADGLLRILGVAFYVWLSLAGFLAVGLLISTLTEVPVAAMAGTLAFGVLSLVLDSIPQLSPIQPYLPTHYWTAFGDLLRASPDYGTLLRHLLVQVVYVGLAGSIAWARFADVDVTA